MPKKLRIRVNAKRPRIKVNAKMPKIKVNAKRPVIKKKKKPVINIRRRANGNVITKAKAKKILKDGTIKGKKITPKQKRFFGLIASGGIPTKT